MIRAFDARGAMKKRRRRETCQMNTLPTDRNNRILTVFSLFLSTRTLGVEIFERFSCVAGAFHKRKSLISDFDVELLDNRYLEV